ncbi:hypothetical protein C7475_101332 [Chitinophaga sp. S165]|nr:hypothetical protein C7475_101332 [Chitinophaga sp. S165]
MTGKGGIWDLISGEVSLENNLAQNEDITTQTR